jgi:hypothetical protein
MVIAFRRNCLKAQFEGNTVRFLQDAFATVKLERKTRTVPVSQLDGNFERDVTLFERFVAIFFFFLAFVRVKFSALQ